jgi:hypothetical protein
MKLSPVQNSCGAPTKDPTPVQNSCGVPTKDSCGAPTKDKCAIFRRREILQWVYLGPSRYVLQNFDGVEYSNFVIAPSVAIVSAIVSCHKFSKGLITMDLDADFGDEEGEEDQSWYMILLLFLLRKLLTDKLTLIFRKFLRSNFRQTRHQSWNTFLNGNYCLIRTR